MPNPNNLTTLAAVKEWLGITTTNSDVQLDRLITQVSRVLLSYMERPSFVSQQYSDVYDGTGGTRIMLRQWPVTEVISVSINNTSVQQLPPNNHPPFGMGWVVQPWNNYPPGGPQPLSVAGTVFSMGASNVSVSYVAGYLVSNEADEVQTGSTGGEDPTTFYYVDVQAPCGPWSVDSGVTLANGTPLVKVEGTPAAGQYALSAELPGRYLFNSAQSAATVLISYSYVPSDIAELATETVGERFRYKDRIGQTSNQLAGQTTIAYSLKDLTDWVKLGLQPYKRVFFY